MPGTERVLSGRPSRHPEPWATGAAASRQGVLAPEPLRPRDPLDDPEVQARIAEVLRMAEERGVAEGRRQGETELAAAVAAARTLAHKLETAVPRDVDMIARTVAELAVTVAHRILGAELRNDPSVLVAAIEAGLRQAAGASMITVELHPLVVGDVESVWGARHGTRHRGFSWSFTGDPTLPVDGCRLRTEHGLVEAGFEDQLAEVAAALDAAIPGYLGAALGPNAEAAEAAERAALMGAPHERAPRPGHPARASRSAPATATPAPTGPAAIHAPNEPAAASPVPATAHAAPDAGAPGPGHDDFDDAAFEAALAASAEPQPADAAPSLFGMAGRTPDDLDLAALATLGLDDLAAFGVGEDPA
jgi:hypothetical protein